MLVKTIAKSLVDEASTAAWSPHFLPLILVLAFVLRATFAPTTDYIARHCAVSLPAVYWLSGPHRQPPVDDAFALACQPDAAVPCL
jgi:hypothetical protein